MLFINLNPVMDTVHYLNTSWVMMIMVFLYAMMQLQ